MTVNKQFKSYKLLPNGRGLYSCVLAPIPSQGEPEHQRYKNREDAVKAALAALGENKLFNSYEIKQDEDGFFFYMLSVKDERPNLNIENPKSNENTSSKEDENKKIEPSPDASPGNASSKDKDQKDKNKEKESKQEKDSSSKANDEEKSDLPQASKNNAKSTNVKTGVAGEAGLFAIIATATAGLFTSKKNR